jgi:citrate lyase subunit beta / citryl-CoA lyase
MITANWSSLLFVPAHSLKHVQSAIRYRPDAVILDLEDGVAPEDKPAARAGMCEAQQLLADANIPCLLRVNSDADNAALDVAAANRDKLAAIIVPKCLNIQSLQVVQQQDVKLIALIESPAAIRELSTIVVHKSVHAIMFGSEDYAVEMGVSPHAKAIEHAAALIAIAASSAGKPAYGVAGSLANFSDLEKFASEIELTRDLGFTGALAIHPSQLPLIKKAFAPKQNEIDWAKNVIAAYQHNSTGAFKLDGRMIDAPIILQAQRILARAVLAQSASAVIVTAPV